MRIVHVFHHYFPFLGGMERAVQGLAEAQVKLNHEVHVLTTTFGAHREPLEVILNGVYIHRVSAKRLHYPDLTIPKTVPVTVFENSDVVHAHCQTSFFSLKMLEKASSLGIATACYFMAVDTLRDHPNIFIRIFGSLYGAKNVENALKIADLKLVKSMRDKEILEKKYDAEAIYLPDAVPNHYLTMRKKSRRARAFYEKHGIKQEKIFLFIGRMHKLKGPHFLVKALKYLNENVGIVFIGPDGGYMKKTLDLAKKLDVRDRVYVLGYVDEETKIQAIDSAEALVLPSIADYVEVFSLVISEGWARKKPVIASKVGGIPCKIKDHINGILVDPLNAESLAKAMRGIINNVDLSVKMGLSGRNEVLPWSEVAINSIQLYHQVLKK